MDADGTGVTRLTYDSANNRSPAWSPDSSKIAFVSFIDGKPVIYVMNADGFNPTILRTIYNTQRDNAPDWKP
jgi:Tol biopolymer transport system component